MSMTWRRHGGVRLAYCVGFALRILIVLIFLLLFFK